MLGIRIFVYSMFTLYLFVAMPSGFAHGAGLSQCSRLFETNEVLWENDLFPAFEIFHENIRNASRPQDEVLRILGLHSGYKKESDHVRTLRDFFKIDFTENGKQASMKDMIKIYENHMRKLVEKKVIKEEDVLTPAFVFVLPNLEVTWIRYGDPIPAGAKLHKRILTDRVFYRMVANGFYPIGNDFIVPTKISSFEHDLAHFTSFVQYPEYMAHLRRYAEKKIKNRQGYFHLENREYFVGEGLVLIKPQMREELMFILNFTPSMRADLDNINYTSLVRYLETAPLDQVIDRLTYLNKNFDKYFDIYGGAGRDPLSGKNSLFHNPYKVMIEKALFDLNEGRTASTAGLQMILIKLSRTTLDDWFEVLEGSEYKNPAIKNLFSDRGVWLDVGNLEMYHQFVTQ